VNLDLTDEAVEYGRQARRGLEAAGGDRLVQRAEAEPGGRGGLIEPVLDKLGAWDLDPRAGTDELEAAAELCRAAGWWAVPYPVAERLCRPTDLDVDGSIVVADHRAAGTVAGLDLRWAAITLDGRRGIATPDPATVPSRRSTFVAELDVEPVDAAGTPVEVALGLVLPCWTLLGMLDRAMTLTRRYVLEREQFGQPLARFQSVQFQLTDAEVERSGFEELARYALWSIEARLDEVLDDALALRLAAIEAADTVFRIAHQLHGAIGFCDETTLSWLSRYSQPLRRLPLGPAGTGAAFTRLVGRRGLTGLFDAGSVG
jgi:3-oxo-4-pregnene-20-carboxyl-CoA dehydrogenase alpha subunit